MALGQHKRRESLGLRQQLGLARQIAGKEVLEDAAVGRVGHCDDGGVVKLERIKWCQRHGQSRNRL